MDDRAFLARARSSRASLVGGGSWWELLIPAGAGRAVPGDRVGHPRRDPALAAAHARARSPSTRCWPATTAPTTPTRATCRWSSSRGGRWSGCCRRTSRSPARDADHVQRRSPCWCRSTAIMVGYEWTHYLVHSDYRPRSRVVPLGVAQPPAAPLQERALLVHRHHRRHGRPAVRHLPRRPAAVETSPTVRQLHALEESR